jgi:aryl-alcohol dehydrogenase-like predicted oxidoreductase
MHWPNADIPSTWKAMEKLVDTGRVRAIGVSNFSVKKLQDLLKYAKVLPAVNQVECHPIWQQHNLHVFCKSQRIHVSVSNIILNECFTKNIIILFMELMWIYYLLAKYGVFNSVLGVFLDSISPI